MFSDVYATNQNKQNNNGCLYWHTNRTIYINNNQGDIMNDAELINDAQNWTTQQENEEEHYEFK